MSPSLSLPIATAEKGPVRVLVVDDSVVVRTVIDRILSAEPGFLVAHKTNMAEHALTYLKAETVDLILLDIELPGLSGLAALPAMLAQQPGAKIVILSGHCEEGSAPAMEALALGASDIVAKPGSGSFGQQFPQALIERLARLFDPACGPDPLPPPVMRPIAELGSAPVACIGIGASTGGIHALGQLFAGLTEAPGVPVLVTQHLPLSFTPYFVQQLGRMTSLPVRVAEQGNLLMPDTVYVAPGDASLLCRRGLQGRVCIMLDPKKTPIGNLPGVDPMFASMADVYGGGSVGIVLTGMGRDGTAGARRIVAAGGCVVAQDQDSSVVWGMPGSVAEAGLSCALMEPGSMMPFIAHRAQQASL